MSSEHDRYIEIWKKAVDTQMHFNEMSVKSRQLGLTFVAAALGVAVVALSRDEDFSLTLFICSVPISFHVAVLLNVAAFLALLAVRELDLNVYHRMLRGAVTFGEDFEQNYLKKIFDLEKGMTQAISHYSRNTDASVDKNGERYEYKPGTETSAEQKIRRFYTTTLTFLIISALIFFVSTNWTQWSNVRTATDQNANQNTLSAPDRRDELTEEIIRLLSVPSTHQENQ
ncbi:hypothetical protein [Parvibaculum sp.]|uniref:hypothetical protein n=1 Tax=Parvibaculum sp. TaxID=2024848 RepID=UPI00349FDC50